MGRSPARIRRLAELSGARIPESKIIGQVDPVRSIRNISMAEHGTVFLMYHELALPNRPLCHREPGYTRYVVPATGFRGHIEKLAIEGWRGTNVTEAMKPFDGKRVCITFDDGCETDLLAAAPILKEFGFGATFYITCGFLGRRDKC